MKPIAISLAFAMAGIAAPGMAQSSGSNAPNAPAAAGTQATPAEASPEQLAAAMELLDANGSIANLGTMLDSLAPLEAEQIKHLDPSIDIATSAAVLTAVRNEIISRKDEYKRLIAGVYARHFSIDEMQKLTAFYRSEAGQKYIETMPSLIKELTPVGAAWAGGCDNGCRSKGFEGGGQFPATRMKSAIVVFPASNCDRDAAVIQWRGSGL